MLSQAYAGTGEQVFADKIRTMVGALTEVRAALRKDPAVLSVSGRFGTAAENVRGSYQYVDLPPGVLGGASAITLSAWVKPTHDGSWERVFDFGDNTTRYMYLAARNAGGVPRSAITTGGAGGEQGLNGTAALPLNPTLSPVTGKPLHYTLDGIEFAPFFEGTEDPTHAYVRRFEPRVVFGNTDSGVASPAKSDGTTLLDEIWAGAPFSGKSALVTRVRSTVDAWVTAGLPSQADGENVVSTAEQATYAR